MTSWFPEASRVPRGFRASTNIESSWRRKTPRSMRQDIVGKRVTLSILQSDMETERYFDGFVSHFAKLPRRPPHRVSFEYEIKIVPWTWFLTRTTNCRIFQEKTVPQVIEQIFQDLSFSDFQIQLSGTHNSWTYCVQYRETAFNFISRLMEKEGIFYFFKHEMGKHTMMIGDKSSVHQNCDFQSTVRMEPSTGSYSREVGYRPALGAPLSILLRKMGSDRLQLRNAHHQSADQRSHRAPDRKKHELRVFRLSRRVR